MDNINSSNRPSSSLTSPAAKQEKEVVFLDMPEFWMEETAAGGGGGSSDVRGGAIDEGQAQPKQPKWLEHLEKHGVAVVKGALSEEDVLHTRQKYWEWLQMYAEQKQRQFKEEFDVALPGITMWDQSSLRNDIWPSDCSGLTREFFCAHQEAAWFARTRPNVRKCFEQIWQTKELIASFDIFIAWRQWWRKDNQQCDEEWYPTAAIPLHADQNPFHQRGMHNVQGMIPFYEVNEFVGGLEVVPDTANDKWQEEMRRRYPHLQHKKRDIALLTTDDPLYGKGQLVRAQPGDLILWDSRTVHGAFVGKGYQDEEDNCPLGPQDFARLSLTICMTPKKWASEDVLEQRRKAFEEGAALTHGGHEIDDASNTKERKLPEYKPVTMTQEVKDLFG